MKTQHPLFKITLLLTLVACAVVTAACTGESGSDLRAWIDFPRDGSEIPAGSLVTVVSHAYAEDGVAEVLLSVNGQAYSRDQPRVAGEFSEVRQEWLAAEPGRYTLQVRTYDAAGAESGQHAISVVVIGEVAAAPTEPATTVATATATAVVSHTPTPTLPPPPTLLATATATSTGVPPTFTPTTAPPTFTPTFTPLPPTFTPTFTPLPPTFTPTPTELPDTTPPPAPEPAVPADGLQLSCRNTQVLAWLPVQDDSGITGYYVRLERQLTANQWDLVREWGPIPDKQTDAENLQCGVFYRWSVRALDGAGNIGPWSVWFHFSIELR